MSSEKHRQINAHIIDSLYVEGSLLLVEETRESNENSSLLIDDAFTNNQAKYVKKPIIEGWDIELNEKSGKDLKIFVKAGPIYEKPEVGYFLSSSKVESQVQDLQMINYLLVAKYVHFFHFFAHYAAQHSL